MSGVFPALLWSYRRKNEEILTKCQTDVKPNYHAQLTVSKFQHANRKATGQHHTVLFAYVNFSPVTQSVIVT